MALLASFRRTVVPAVVAMLVALSPSAGGQGFTLDDYARLTRLSDVRVAPDGRHAAMVVTRPNFDVNTWETEIVRVDLASGETQSLARRRSAAMLRWSPGGDRLAFLAAVDGRRQIFVLPLSGGEPRQLTASPTGVTAFAWRPDGRALAFAAAPPLPQRSRFDDAFEVDGNDYLAVSAPRNVHLWLIGADGGPAQVLAKGDWSIPAAFWTIDWSPDGKRIVFARQDAAGTRYRERRSLAVADVATGQILAIDGVSGKRCGPAFGSPDGQSLLLSCPVEGHVKNQVELAVVPASGGTPRRLTQGIDRNFEQSVVWRPDSRGVVALANDGPGSGVWEIALDGSFRRMPMGDVVVRELDVASDGAVVFIGSEVQRPAELYVLRPQAKAPTRLTDIHRAVAAMSLGAVQTLDWTSHDGLPLDGVLTFPPDFDAGKKYPLLLNIHGGPWGSSKATFSARSQLLASKGFIVFEPNYRGSDNLGNALYAAYHRDHGDGPGRDVMAGLEILKRRPYVDTARIGVSGWSNGGYVTTWLIARYSGWRAALAGAAVIDLVDYYNLNDISLYLRTVGETITSPADLALLREQSPLTYVDSMTTPLLLLAIQGDARVPITQSYKLFNALRERGRDVHLKVWPVSGHSPADPWRARDVDRAWAAWFEQLLK